MYLEMVGSGIRYLDLHRTTVNDLNVFPVPDGDTGTNMVMTLRYGLDSVRERPESIGDASRELARNAVFGARGNSGVILSQFVKGISESLEGKDEADSEALARAFSHGARRAYSAVAKPVEGTMLTVLKDAAKAVEDVDDGDGAEVLMEKYLAAARISLANTPELLPILKKARVVDSGGAGIVYLFEGMRKYLCGETVNEAEQSDRVEDDFDYSLIDKNTRFDYGFCVEGLIQLKTDPEDFDENVFRSGIESRGSSVVITLVGDKLKLHVHSSRPGRILEYCQSVGELLTVKIENMTIQNMRKSAKESDAASEKFLTAEEPSSSEFAIVAVAPNPTLQRMFSDMGADVVILSDIAPSSQEFMEAFDLVADRDILVFPNSSNSVLSSMQAGGLYRRAFVSVINCRSIPECYSALAIMDFDGTKTDAIRSSREAISNIFEFSVYHARKDTTFGKREIHKNDFFAISGNKLLTVGETLESVTMRTVERAIKDKECAAMTVFYGESIAEEFVNSIIKKIDALGLDIEIVAKEAGEISASLTVMIE